MARKDFGEQGHGTRRTEAPGPKSASALNAALGILLLYVGAMAYLGFALGRRAKGTADFFVAGRRMGPGLLCATVLAANIGAGSTVFAASLGYEDGVAAWWWVGSAGIGTLVLALWIGPRMWRAAKAHSLLTVGDYLERRYGPSVRAAMAALLWLASLAILAAQLIAMAWILEVVAGAPRWVGAVAGGAVMTLYFAAGGLLSSAWVNLVQLAVLAIGFLVAAPLAAGAAGGWGDMLASNAALDPGRARFWGNGGSGWPYLALLAPAFIASPGILQKTFAARDERACRRGLAACAGALMLFAFLPVALGMAARVLAPGLDDSETALPVVLSTAVPAWVGLLGLAAVLSAEISSADAILFMLSTSLSKDLYKRFFNPSATDRQVLAASRGAAVVGGAAGVALAVLLPTVGASLAVFYSLLSVSLFVPLAAGLHSRRPGVAEAFAAIAAGSVALVAARVCGAEGAAPPTAWGLGAATTAFGCVFAVRRLARLRRPRSA